MDKVSFRDRADLDTSKGRAFTGLPHIRESASRNLGNSESWALKSGIQLKKSGIPQTIGILNPSRIPETEKFLLPEIWNPGLWNLEYSSKKSGIPLTIKIQTDKMTEIQYLESRQNPRTVLDSLNWPTGTDPKSTWVPLCFILFG